jgi:hypothetical protein
MGSTGHLGPLVIAGMLGLAIAPEHKVTERLIRQSPTPLAQVIAAAS